MINHKVEFQNIEWKCISTGAHQKVYENEEKRLRLLRLEDSFLENDWCLNGHTGFVIRGQMTIVFDGRKVSYKAGDGLIINKGEKEKHKAIVDKGRFVELLLVEDKASS